jgi:hypothetical protein
MSEGHGFGAVFERKEKKKKKKTENYNPNKRTTRK